MWLQMSVPNNCLPAHSRKYPARNRRKKIAREPYMSRDFCPEVIVLVPKPYCWFTANPAISFSCTWNVGFAAPHTGHPQSLGRFCSRVQHVSNSMQAGCTLYIHKQILITEEADLSNTRITAIKSIRSGLHLGSVPGQQSNSFLHLLTILQHFFWNTFIMVIR